MKKILASVLVLTLISVFTTMCFATNDEPSDTTNANDVMAYSEDSVRYIIVVEDDYDDLWMCGLLTFMGATLGTAECITQ